MGGAVLLCADGSEASIRALQAGLALLGSTAPLDVVTVIDPPDAMLVTGTGFASGVMDADEFDELNRSREATAAKVVKDAARALGVPDAAAHVLQGAPGPALCDYATQTSAAAIVLGTRGQGGVKRAVLGSVSDHVIRNAPCPVVVTSYDGG